MSDRMRPMPFEDLMCRALSEHRDYGSVFGVNRCFRAGGKTLEVLGQGLETPIGLAAGPHTQLAQNIVSGYVAGARFFELKTVQTLDGEDLPVSKPCIDARDECYNVEWSTELRVPQALDEYIKAWFALNLLARELGLGNPSGFAFNMSVGYDYEGISSPYIDSFIEGLKNAADTDAFKDCQRWVLDNIGMFKRVDGEYVKGISPKICSSVTLSTLHGCPPEEIERIAQYLIEQKGLHTFVKCNPTLLGYNFARGTLDGMGYELSFDEHHFANDLQYDDALPMFGRLIAVAQKKELTFGVKLTNTFPVKIINGELPGEEMYMSGKALYPLTCELAKRVSRDMGGRLRISFSGGADAFNVKGLFEAGVYPITVASTLLKPGGYLRLHQMAELLWGCNYSLRAPDSQALGALEEAAIRNPLHRKALKTQRSARADSTPPLIDCFVAPCELGCPINQDIPEYLGLVGEGKNLEALRLIVRKNPLPFITGTLCSHRCMASCTRNYYEQSVRIREAKLTAAKGGYDTLIGELSPARFAGDKKVAIIGGGPAGLAASYLLAKRGIASTLFEKREQLGGVIRYVIPGFRIDGADIDKDIALVKRLGGEFVLGKAAPALAELRGMGYTHVFIAIGAHEELKLQVDGASPLGALEFLEQFNLDGYSKGLGKDVAVVGGGNTAMDVARAAKKVKGVERVRLIYRRTKRQMPADEEELRLAMDDGVEFLELLAPLSLTSGLLECERLKLGDPGRDGRRSPVGTGELIKLPADSLIAAVGESVDTSTLSALGIELDGRCAKLDENLQTSIPGVFLIGDCAKGPASVVQAIADATKAINAIAGEAPTISRACPSAKPRAQKGVLRHWLHSDHNDAGRCLNCAVVCENCADVCPNRANAVIISGGKSQILHIDSMCNECGNCAAFCPYEGSPYKDKYTYFDGEKDMQDSTNDGFYMRDAHTAIARLGGAVTTVDLNAPGDFYRPLAELMSASLTMVKPR